MRVKMRTLMAGPSGVVKPGDVIQVSSEYGAELIAGRFAIAVDAWECVETMSEQPAETAMRKRGRPRNTIKQE